MDEKELLQARDKARRLEGLVGEARGHYFAQKTRPRNAVAAAEFVLADHGIFDEERETLRSEICAKLGHGGGKETAAREKQLPMFE